MIANTFVRGKPLMLNRYGLVRPAAQPTVHEAMQRYADVVKSPEMPHAAAP
jgi:hypothetical protein